MSNSKRVIKNTIFLYIRMAVSILVNVFTTNILLRALGASDYGLYSVVGGAVTMLNFVSASMSSVTQRFLNYTEGKGDPEHVIKVFNNAKIIHLTIAVFTVVFLALAGLAFFNGVLNIPIGRESSAIIVYVCLVLSVVFSITITPYDAVINAHENMLYYSILGIADVIVKFLISVSILYSDGDRLIWYAIFMVIESWLVQKVTKTYCIKHYSECKPGLMRFNYDKGIIKEMASFAGWSTLNITSGMLSLYGMGIVLNHFYGTVINAAMGVATQLAGVLMGVSQNMLKALTPLLVRTEASQQRQRMLDISYIGCRYSFLLFSFFCIPIFLVMPTVLRLWLFEVPEWTVVFCRLMLVSSLIEQLFTFLYQTINAEGRIKYYNISRSVVNILPIICGIICCFYGLSPYWVIVNWIIFYNLIGGLINLYFSCRNVGLSAIYFLKNVILPIISVTTIVLLTYLIILYIETKMCIVINDIVVLFLIFIISIPIYWFVGMAKLERNRILSIFIK